MPGDTGAEAPIASASTNSNSSDTSAPQASQTQDSAASTVPDFRKFPHRLKINEKEEDVSYDDLLVRAQKSAAADRRFESAAAKERRIHQMIDRAKNHGDWSALEALIGEDATVAFAESRIGKVIDWNKLSPEKQEAIKEKQRADAAEARAKEYEQNETRRANAFAIAQETKKIDQEMHAAFTAKGLPVTPELIYWAADYMSSVMPDDEDENQEYEPMPASEGLGRALRRYESDAAKILPNLPKEQRLRLAPLLVNGLLSKDVTIQELRAALPKEFLDALRKANLQDVEGQGPTGTRATAIQRDPTSQETGRRSNTRKIAATTDEMFASMEANFKKQQRRG